MSSFYLHYIYIIFSQAKPRKISNQLFITVKMKLLLSELSLNHKINNANVIAKSKMRFSCPVKKVSRDKKNLE